jgi:hypothetical protein
LTTPLDLRALLVEQSAPQVVVVKNERAARGLAASFLSAGHQSAIQTGISLIMTSRRDVESLRVMILLGGYGE